MKRNCVEEALSIAWRLPTTTTSNDADDFLIVTERGILIYHDGEQVRMLRDDKRRYLCAVFVTATVIVSGDDTGALTFWQWDSTIPLSRYDSAHDVRVKAVGVVPTAGPFASVVSASSDGVIRMWHLRGCPGPGDDASRLKLRGDDDVFDVVLVGEERTNSRITCLAAGPGGVTLPPTS